MSLNWDISGIRDYDELKVIVNDDGDWKLDARTEAFIWTSMATGLGRNWSLDADFAPEFYARVKLLEELDGPLVNYPKDSELDGCTSWQDVERRIGLKVNVSPVSRASFIKNVVTRRLDSAKQRYETEAKQLAELEARVSVTVIDDQGVQPGVLTSDERGDLIELGGEEK
jgi:hypothetical protein